MLILIALFSALLPVGLLVLDISRKDKVPFEDLTEEEQKKDKILIDNSRSILTGEGQPIV